MLLRPGGRLGPVPRSPLAQHYRAHPRAGNRSRRGSLVVRALHEANLRVVFVSTEVAPWSKVGGLADVLAALPSALAARGHSVMTLTPRYAPYPDTQACGTAIPLHLPQECFSVETPTGEGSTACDAAVDHHASLFFAQRDGVEHVFVDHPLLRTENIYASGGSGALTYTEADHCSGLDLRYSILCQAALAAPVALPSWRHAAAAASGAGVVYVANDWPSAVLLLRLRYLVQQQPVEGGVAGASPEALQLQQLLAQHLSTAATAYCIHNIAYQGVFPAQSFPRLCLPPAALPALCSSADWRGVLDGQRGEPQCPGGEVAAPAATECSGGSLNWMRSAVLACDEVVTVSPSYAEEICTDERMGCGLGDMIAAKGITGIMNGIDVQEWDPASDPLLPPEGRYTSGTLGQGKAAMKALVQRRLGLAVDPAAPLLVFIGRLTQQKGVDVLMDAAPAVLAPRSPPAPHRAPRIVANGGPRPFVEGCTTLRTRGTRSNAIAAPRLVGTSVRISNGASAQLLDLGSPAGGFAASAMQLAVLGAGDAGLQTAVTGLSASFPGQAVGVTAFSEELAHWLLAAADYCIVPSRFEPCGLVALCAARYGAVPITTCVGGFKDWVTPDVGLQLPALSSGADAAAHRGDVQALAAVMQLAAAECGGACHRSMQRTCMELDLSWYGPAQKWEVLLQRLARLRARPRPRQEPEPEL